MTPLWILVLLPLIGATSAVADVWASDDVEPTVPGLPEFHTLMLDPGLRMGSGMETILASNHLTGAVENRLIGNQWFSEEELAGKVGGISCRLAKRFFLDTPLDYFAVVLAHEFYGHGARYRELSVDNIDYGYDAPPPYGAGGGHATASISDPISPDEIMTILIGGIESQAIINRKLGMRWIANRGMRYRESMLYYWSFRIMFDYIQHTRDDLDQHIDGKDPSEYLKLLNIKAGIADLSDPRMKVSYLHSRSRIGLINPLLWYSMFAQFKSYLWDGKTTTKVPMIPLGEVGYLPALRMSLTPFGPEYHFENYIRFRSMVALADLHIGDTTFYDSWGGFDLGLQNLVHQGRISVDLELAAWNQPGVELERNIQGMVGEGAGGAFSCTAHIDLREEESPLSAAIQLGYKTGGFLEGWDLDASPIFAIGLGYRAH